MKKRKRIEKREGKDFLTRTLLTLEMGTTIDIWDLTKLKSFCMEKEIIDPVNRKPKKLEETFTSYISNCELIGRITQITKKSTKQTTQ